DLHHPDEAVRGGDRGGAGGGATEGERAVPHLVRRQRGRPEGVRRDGGSFGRAEHSAQGCLRGRPLAGRRARGGGPDTVRGGGAADPRGQPGGRGAGPNPRAKEIPT